MSEAESASSTPGSNALIKLKSRVTSVVEFKQPTACARKKKPRILTEEKYIEELAKIIQRDFFPDLEKLRAQNDYLDAMDRKDYAQMAAIRAKYSDRLPTENNGAMSPATFETPISHCNSTPHLGHVAATPKSTSSNATRPSLGDDGSKSISERHSLDSFLQAYTSEDNYSFQEIIETADEKLRQKFAILYNEEKLSTEKLARALTLPTIEEQFGKPDPMRKIETWTYQNKNSIMYIPDGVALTETELVEKASRKPSVHHSATRFDVNPFDDSKQSKSASNSVSQVLTEKVGLDGNAVDATGKALPKIRGFNLVTTPSPRPGEAFSPLMTWGEIEGTPFRLDGSDTPVRSNAGPSFKINETSRRETIAIALAEKVGEKMRAQKQRAKDTARKNMGTPFLRSNMERLASMSPAARRLATTKWGLRTPLLTPTPLRTPGALAKRKSSGSSKIHTVDAKRVPLTRDTALASAPATPKDSNIEKSTLTDDLLKIPTKRLKAADFF